MPYLSTIEEASLYEGLEQPSDCTQYMTVKEKQKRREQRLELFRTLADGECFIGMSGFENHLRVMWKVAGESKPQEKLIYFSRKTNNWALNNASKPGVMSTHADNNTSFAKTDEQRLQQLKSFLEQEACFSTVTKLVTFNYGVRGSVVAISPLQPKRIEMGSPSRIKSPGGIAPPRPLA